MDTATVLIGFSEIAIALAGFTTIATVIVRVSDSTSHNLLAIRLKTILLFSIHLIVISVLPVTLFQLDLDPSPDQFWRWSAILSLASGAIVAYIGFLHLLPLTLRDDKNSWWQTIGVSTLGTMSMLTTALVIAGGNPVFWYMATLSLVLGASLTMLVGLILSFPVFDVHRTISATNSAMGKSTPDGTNAAGNS